MVFENNLSVYDKNINGCIVMSNFIEEFGLGFTAESEESITNLMRLVAR